jgi:hypothetical protein
MIPRWVVGFALIAAVLVVVGIDLLFRAPAPCPTYTMTDLLHMADPVPECK